MKLRRPGPRLTAGLLIASLCLNLFAVGAFGAALIWRDEHRGPGFGLVERAPDDARTVLRHLFEERRDDFRARMDAVRAARRAIGELLQNGETDPGRLRDAFTRMREAFDGIETLTHETIVAAIPQLSPEDRAEWAQQWIRGPRD